MARTTVIPARSSGRTPSSRVLKSGVTLITAPMDSPNVGVFLIVRAGARDETRETSGLAHFLEHMFFKGTTNRPTSLQITREIDRLGATTNAYTDVEEVAYYTTGPAAAVSSLSTIITDMLCHPLFDGSEMEKERNVVLQELAARLADPDGWLWDRLGTVTFGDNQPMSWSAAGFPEVIGTVTRDQLVAYHASFYAPQAMALVIAGGGEIDEDEADALFADIPSASQSSRTASRWGRGERFVCDIRPVAHADEEQNSLLLAFPGFPALDEDRTALSVFAHIYGGGMSSRLFQKVREERGLCYSIFAHHEGFDDAGAFVVSTGTRPKDAKETLALALDEFHSLVATPVPADELEAAKSAMTGRLLRATETAMSRARYYGSRWRAGLPLDAPEDRADAIGRVTADEIQHVAARLETGLGLARFAFVGPRDISSDICSVLDSEA